jgi:hypothetical protein
MQVLAKLQKPITIKLFTTQFYGTFDHSPLDNSAILPNLKFKTFLLLRAAENVIKNPSISVQIMG